MLTSMDLDHMILASLPPSEMLCVVSSNHVSLRSLWLRTQAPLLLLW